MELVDARIKTRKSPGYEIVRQLLEHVSPEVLRGIGAIVVADDASDDPGRAAARYAPTQRDGRGATIEIFLQPFEDLPHEARAFEPFLVYHLARSLGHELYHHRRVSRGMRRRPKKREETEAENWAGRVADFLYNKLVDHRAVELEWARIRPLVDEWITQQENSARRRTRGRRAS